MGIESDYIEKTTREHETEGDYGIVQMNTVNELLTELEETGDPVYKRRYRNMVQSAAEHEFEMGDGALGAIDSLLDTENYDEILGLFRDEVRQ